MAVEVFVAQIRRSYPYLGISFLAITKPFWANWTKNFYGNLGDYYLSIGDDTSKLWCLFLIFGLLASFSGKMGLATTHAPNGLGPPDPTKKLAHRVEFLGQLLSRNHFFEIFRPEVPSPLNENKWKCVSGQNSIFRFVLKNYQDRIFLFIKRN